MRRVLRFLGIVIEDMTREEAARWLLEREVRFVWRPQVVEVADRPTGT